MNGSEEVNRCGKTHIEYSNKWHKEPSSSQISAEGRLHSTTLVSYVVWLASKDFQNPQECKNMRNRYISPTRSCRVNEVIYKLDLPPYYRSTPTFHMSCLMPVIAGPLATTIPTATPLTLLEIEGQSVHIVQAILNSCYTNGKLEYLINWEDYSWEEQYWVPAHDILDPLWCQGFHAKHPEKPGPYPRGYSRVRSSVVGGLLSHLHQTLKQTSIPRERSGQQTWPPWTTNPNNSHVQSPDYLFHTPVLNHTLPK